MIRNKNIICISSIDWDFIWQGHQEIISAYAKNGNTALFIENTGVRIPGVRDIPRISKRVKNWFSGISGIRKKMDNLYIFSPLLLPFPYSRLALWINRHLIFAVLQKWIRVMNFCEPIIWVFLPTPLSLSIIENLDNKIVIYYCIDNFRASSASAKKIEGSEIKLLKKADLVFATSRELQSYCSTFNNKVYFFPFAVNFQEFNMERLNKNAPPEEIKDIRKPIIGYVGGVHKWIDFNLIRQAALKYPQYSFVFVGPVQTDISLLSELKNVHLLGKKEHWQIPNFIKNFDLCIIPYLITDYTKNVYPTKLNEYLAMGKAVLSTDLPEVVNFNLENDDLVLVGKTGGEFINCIPKAINDASESLVERRIAAAKKNSWAERIEEMNHLIEETVDAKAKLSLDWKDGFLSFYRVARRKSLKIASLVLCAYLLVFYTPFVWFLAGPLKISQTPKKADCIVVFAGGVGESGKAGQGYEERVQHAVELYKKGYSQHIIFSSGYMFIFKEPLVMKAVAVSLGVPQEAIILEDRASGTYQNVKFSNGILLKNAWNNIILVSSPYHMRRVALVFNKIAKNIKVTYSPIINSSFYSQAGRDEYGRRIWKRINLEQIKGIFHEYLAILYYWWKGKI